MNFFLSFFLAAAVGASAQLPAVGLTWIGAAAAVRGLVNATAPGATVGRVVQSGKPLYLNDHVTTDAAGRLQVLLLDQTVFTVGPNSDMVLDEFVYDPATDKGKVTARITKGVFRFVTGKVARKDPASMKVNLPVGTIGIRGTIAAGQVSGQSATVILLGPGSQNNANENPGAVFVFNANGRVDLTQPGFGTTLGPGGPPTSPVDMSALLQQLLGALGLPPSGGPHAAAMGDSETSATHAAGQGTAAGGIFAGTAGGVLDLSDSANTTQQVASQTFAQTIADGLSTWDQVRSVQTGTGYYQGTGDYSCSGGACAKGMTVAGGLNFAMNVDFAARAITGGSVSLTPGSAGGISDATSINRISYGAAGNAVTTLSAANGNDTNSNFDNTTLSFMNRDGTAAKDMKVDLVYASSYGPSASGSATGTLMDLPNTIADGLSTWDQVRGVQTGTGYYQGTGDYSFCLGGSCSTAKTVTGGLSLTMNVDFAARAITSGSLSLNSGNAPNNLGGISDSTSFNQIKYGSSTGNAVTTLTAANGSLTNSNFDNTTLSFMNRGGTAAKDVTVKLAYASSSGGSASGSVTGTLSAPPIRSVYGSAGKSSGR